MKNKFLVLALLVIFLPVSFTSCGDNSPKAVKEVNVTAVGTDLYLLTWEAVGKNVLDYEVLAKQKDKASVFQIAVGIGDLSGATDFDTFSIVTNQLAGGFVTNQVAFISSGGTVIPAPNTNIDKWYAVISKTNMVPVNGKYYFGVRAISTTAEYSNIKWSKDDWGLTSAVVEMIGNLY
jgi:hypothetical protein